MLKNVNFKLKLMLYYLLTQISLFILFGIILFHFLEVAIHDKLEANLQVIILDLKDDVMKHHNTLKDISLDNEIDEFHIRPLYIKIVANNQEISTSEFPHEVKFKKQYVQNKIYFDIDNHFAFSSMHFTYLNSNYAIKLATPIKHIADIFPSLVYILSIAIPFILIIAIFLGNLLINKSLAPINKLLNEIKIIDINDFSKRVNERHTGDEIDKIAHEINKLLQRVDEAYSNVSQFTSNASHELKTPLTIIQGELEVLLKEIRQPHEYEKSITSVLEEVKKIKKIIESLILLAKVKSELLLQDEIYIDEILLDVKNELQLYAQEKNISILTDIQDPVTIHGNAELFAIALKNIIENSIFYSYENRSIQISLKNTHNDNFKLSIKDSGIGMNHHDLKNIFEKFYRSDSSRSKNTGGLGLGMSITKKICTFHKLAIDVKSALDVGTEFIITKNNIF